VKQTRLESLKKYPAYKVIKRAKTTNSFIRLHFKYELREMCKNKYSINKPQAPYPVLLPYFLHFYSTSTLLGTYSALALLFKHYACFVLAL
jgi:hypothetical protein